MTTSEFIYAPEEYDAIARAGCESLVFHPGKVAAYDLEGYERVDHQPVEPGGYPYFNEPQAEQQEDPSVPDTSLGDSRYLLRMGGFRRQNIFGPCEAADMIAAAGVNYADGLGEGLFEHLLLCRRTGVQPIFEVPTMGMPLPFLASELPRFESLYRRHVLEYRDWIQRAETVYGHPCLTRPGHPWILYLPVTPLMLFQLSADRKPEETAGELRDHAGVSRLTAAPIDPPARAGQARAWAFIRRRHMEVLAVVARVFREIAAPEGLLVGNMHTLPIVDYQGMGEVFDHPGVAARSGYIAAPALRAPYMGYSVRLFSDLSGRLPIMSVRINTLVSGTRFIPGPDTIRAWFDTALRHGVAGFYYWTMDYPSREGQYFGSLPGNPDPSTRGPERWHALLDCFRDIAPARPFVPPASTVALLVADEVLDIAGWRRVLGCFTELELAKIYTNLIPARKIVADRSTLNETRMLVVPALPFASDAMVEALEDYVQIGGTLVLADRCFAPYDLDGRPRRPPFGLTENQRHGRDAIDRPVGKGRVVASAAPGLGTAIDAGDMDAALANAVQQWQRIASAVPLEQEHWMYRINAANLRRLTGEAPSDEAPKPEPNVEPKAYLYEHSSPLIIPHINSPKEFGKDDGPSCR